MLVTFATLVTANLDSVALLAILDESLTVAGTSLTSFLKLVASLISRAVIQIVFLDGTTIKASLRFGQCLMSR